MPEQYINKPENICYLHRKKNPEIKCQFKTKHASIIFILCTHAEKKLSGFFSSAPVFAEDITIGFHSKLLSRVFFLLYNFTLIFAKHPMKKWQGQVLALQLLPEIPERLLGWVRAYNSPSLSRLIPPTSSRTRSSTALWYLLKVQSQKEASKPSLHLRNLLSQRAAALSSLLV